MQVAANGKAVVLVGRDLEVKTDRLLAAGFKPSYDLQDALQTMYDSDGPYFIEVTVEMEENVFPMVPAGESISNMLHGLA